MVTSDPQTSTTGTISSTSTTSPPGEAEDLLAFARGVLLVSAEGLEENEGVLYQLIDGNTEPVTFTTASGGAVSMVFRLPVNTEFDWLGVAPVIDARSGAAFEGSVLVEGSIDGPGSGFVELVEVEVGSAADGSGAVPAGGVPVKWLRVTLTPDGSGGQGRGRIVLAELIGFGVEEHGVETSTAFNGIWDLRLLGRPESAGERLELIQDGTLVTGCLDTLEIRATVNGAVALGIGREESSGREAAVVLVADEEGTISATVAFDNGRFETRLAHAPARETDRQCSLPESESAVCDTPLYVNFAYDSAEIRSESEAVLDDIYRILVQVGVESVTVRGHTSTEGTDEHNLVLSEERAQAVVSELIERGFPAEGISAVGLGESEPIVFPDDDEASRSINRRVELECG